VSRVFVTGAGGFVGSRLVRRLEAAGLEVTALSRRPPEEPVGPAVRWVEGDVTEPDSYRAELGESDRVIHLAARLTARRAEEYELANVTGTARLLETCATKCRHLHRVVVVSTVAAMGPRRDGKLLSETDPCSPTSVYGASKLAAEGVALALASYLPITILRPVFVYGPGDARGAGYLEAWLRSPPGAWESPIRTLSLVHVDDFAHACDRALSSDLDSGTIILVAAPASCDWGDVRGAVADALSWLGSDGGIERDLANRLVERIEALDPATRDRSADGAGRPMGPPPEWWGCDASRAQRLLGLEYTRTLADGARETLASYAAAGFFDAAHWGSA
jgi:nucleoside-diphosphate-sugar epimerase